MRVRVQRVIDGDTIELVGGQRVRMIGIDAPESGRSGAAEATQFVKGKIGVNSNVWLESDGDDKDDWDRLRRYVWLQEPASQPSKNQICQYMLNALLLSEGFARATGNHRYDALFQQL